MRLIASADWHIRSTSPQFRIDNYPESILKKIEFIVDTANKYNAGIAVAGDIFHSVSVKYTYFNKLSDILRRCKKPIYAVPGQHDMEHHKHDLIHSPFYALESSGVIINVDKRCVNGVAGLGYNSEFEKGTLSGDLKILLIHFCVTTDNLPFFLEGKADTARNIIQKYKMFSHIIAGDYHIPHTKILRNRLLINCGSIGRTNIDQMEHVPSIYLVNTNIPKKYKRIHVPVENAADVFSKAAFIEKEDDSKITEQIKEIAKLLKDKDKRPNFRNIVHYLMRKSNTTKEQKEIAHTYLGSEQ